MAGSIARQWRAGLGWAKLGVSSPVVPASKHQHRLKWVNTNQNVDSGCYSKVISWVISSSRSVSTFRIYFCSLCIQHCWNKKWKGNCLKDSRTLTLTQVSLSLLSLQEPTPEWVLSESCILGTHTEKHTFVQYCLLEAQLELCVCNLNFYSKYSKEMLKGSGESILNDSFLLVIILKL